MYNNKQHTKQRVFLSQAESLYRASTQRKGALRDFIKVCESMAEAHKLYTAKLQDFGEALMKYSYSVGDEMMRERSAPLLMKCGECYMSMSAQGSRTGEFFEHQFIPTLAQLEEQVLSNDSVKGTKGSIDGLKGNIDVVINKIGNSKIGAKVSDFQELERLNGSLSEIAPKYLESLQSINHHSSEEFVKALRKLLLTTKGFHKSTSKMMNGVYESLDGIDTSPSFSVYDDAIRISKTDNVYGSMLRYDSSKWKACWVQYDKSNNTLTVSNKWINVDEVKVNLKTCSLKQVEHKGSKSLKLISPKRTQIFKSIIPEEISLWEELLLGGIQASLSYVSSNASKDADALKESIMHDIWESHFSNGVCADCGNPKWISMNLGVVICIQCAGAHRSLGTHISKVRSLEMDILSDCFVNYAKVITNKTINDVYLAFFTPSKGVASITPESSQETRVKFIKAKYSDCMYIADKPEEEIVDCILGQNMIGLLQHIANGTNINQRVQSDKKTLLHAAITVGNANIITCLGINGIDMNRADSKGYAPLHYAFLNGLPDMVSLLCELGADPKILTPEGHDVLSLPNPNIPYREEMEEIIKQASSSVNFKRRTSVEMKPSSAREPTNERDIFTYKKSSSDLDMRGTVSLVHSRSDRSQSKMVPLATLRRNGKKTLVRETRVRDLKSVVDLQNDFVRSRTRTVSLHRDESPMPMFKRSPSVKSIPNPNSLNDVDIDILEDIKDVLQPRRRGRSESHKDKQMHVSKSKRVVINFDLQDSAWADLISKPIDNSSIELIEMPEQGSLLETIRETVTPFV